MRTLEKWLFNRSLLTGLLALLITSTAFSSEPKLTGSLKTVNGIKVLTLTGTPKSNGFSRGFLMSREILDSLEGVNVKLPKGIDFGKLVPTILPRLIRPRHDKAEIEGIIEGMRAKLGDKGITMKCLGRPLTADDLWCIMAMPDLHCSAFAAWGKTTKDGKLLIGRNLDYIGKEYLGKSSCIVVHQPKDAKQKAWLDISLSPLPGATTAINADGVFVAILDAQTTGNSKEPARLRPFVMRDFLGSVDGTKHLADQVGSFFRKQPILRGTSFIISSPISKGLVVEYDCNRKLNNGVTIRQAEKGQDWIAVTNHFRNRSEPKPCGRYKALSEALIAAENSKNQPGSLQEGWKIITKASQGITLLTVAFSPEEQAILVSFTNGTQPANKFDPIKIELAKLFEPNKP